MKLRMEMMTLKNRVFLCASLAVCVVRAQVPPKGGDVEVVLPDYSAELQAFDESIRTPVEWHRYIVNAGFGGGRGGPERKGGWLNENYVLMDYLDRSGDYVSHEWLTFRGIWHEVYGSNEYQETIHFHEKGARELFWDNGIARDMLGERTLSAHYNTSHEWWKKKIGWDAFIVCNNAPRWSAVINYDLLTSPLFGDSTSQDNIGGPTSRIGKGSHGRYCDHCNRKFFHHLEMSGRLPEFRQRYSHIRDYVQENLLDLIKTLPPYSVEDRFRESEAERILELGSDPVMAEYTRFLYISHIHNMMRYYRDQRSVAKRLGKHYDTHGNMGGGFVGGNPYQIALADFVDMVWFESAGQSTYDLFKHKWHNAWGAFRFVLGNAMLRGRKPLLCMSKFHKKEPDLVAHELAEQCAGGAVLFVAQHAFAKRPELLELMQDFFELRHHHRAIFASHRKRRHCQVAMVYSVPTMMPRNYMAAVACPPAKAMSGLARALEDAHIPFDAVILNHPDIHKDFVDLEDLERYRLLLLPVIECLSDAQVDKVGRYLDGGGTLGIVGEVGIRDENGRPRGESVVDAWRQRGRVVDVTPTPGFQPPRGSSQDVSRQATANAAERVRKALGGESILGGELPATLWVKTWTHDCGVLSLHFVNYDIDFESARAMSTAPIRVSVQLPDGIAAEEARFLTPGGAPVSLSLTFVGAGRVAFELPSVRVYGMVLIGKKGLDRDASALELGDALIARASYACRGEWGEVAERAASATGMRGAPGAYAVAAEELLRAVTGREQTSLMDDVAAMPDTADAVLALDFGGEQAVAGWKAVASNTTYSEQIGFGWLAHTDTSTPSPEEIHYALAAKFHRDVPYSIQRSPYLMFWPYKPAPPAPLRYSLCCGGPRRFRTDLANGRYNVRVVTNMPSWTQRNFFVSGMVAANGAPVLLDVPMFKGGLAGRTFMCTVTDEKLDLTFGGPTGWAVSALIVTPAQDTIVDPLAVGALREWRVSPRYANTDWYPIYQTRTSVEKNMRAPDTKSWSVVRAPEAGIGVVDLGANCETDVGDVVYAVTTLTAPANRSAKLHLGVSSQAMAWINGKSIAYLPNVKGVERDEFVGDVLLKAGDNTLVIKLCRFWERRWQFYASVTGE